MLEIECELEGWGPDLEDYYLYELWYHRKILPYSGGWMDQPLWVHRLFNRCGLLDEYQGLNKKLPDAKGMPSLRDLAHKQE
jgi:hypothetical protein